MRVLLVEDDEGDALIVRELLAEAETRIEIDWRRSLAEAVDVVDDRFHCVLLDLGLPDASGLDALRRVLETAPGAAVLVLTGLDDRHRGNEAVAWGAQDYLVKGQVDTTLLERALRYAVERKRADEQLRRLYASELRSAENARLERGLLPQPQTADPALSIVTRYQPGRDAELGGDFYDVVETPDGCLHVLVGDVCGHGPDEAALGVCLRIAWRTLVLSGIDRERLMPVLEEVLVRERRSEEIFATLCMLVVEPDRSSLRLYLAGHPAPLMLGDDVAQLPDELVGPALGVLPGVVWGSRVVELPPRWRILLFSDGLIEGRVGDGADRLGVEGLVELVASSPLYDEAGALVDHLVATARKLHGEDLPDDVAAVVVSYQQEEGA
jgi:serine phosphatase RsbU (regulator of sigma subunit)